MCVSVCCRFGSPRHVWINWHQYSCTRARIQCWQAGAFPPSFCFPPTTHSHKTVTSLREQRAMACVELNSVRSQEGRREEKTSGNYNLKRFQNYIGTITLNLATEWLYLVSELWKPDNWGIFGVWIRLFLFKYYGWRRNSIQWNSMGSGLEHCCTWSRNVLGLAVSWFSADFNS